MRKKSLSYKLLIIITCGIFLLTLFLLFIYLLKEALFITEIKKWKIFNYDDDLIKKYSKNKFEKKKRNGNSDQSVICLMNKEFQNFTQKSCFEKQIKKNSSFANDNDYEKVNINSNRSEI